MQCLIVAAGEGSRLRAHGPLKPLVTLDGAPLIERVILGALKGGATAFIVVSGYLGETLRAALDDFAARTGIAITHVINDEWKRANGVSVFKARDALGGRPFLLTMCDHLADPAIIRGLIAGSRKEDSVTLAVDFNIVDPLNDIEDVTRVRCERGHIRAIGKLIDDYNAFDTGFFLATSAFFPALEESSALGDDSISGAMRRLAARDQALTHDIGNHVWLDVDDGIAYDKALELVREGRL
jgi:1L-myo-inositol 1-phosphate cytidylyltransferase